MVGEQVVDIGRAPRRLTHGDALAAGVMVVSLGRVKRCVALLLPVMITIFMTTYRSSEALPRISLNIVAEKVRSIGVPIHIVFPQIRENSGTTTGWDVVAAPIFDLSIWPPNSSSSTRAISWAKWPPTSLSQ